MSQNTSNLIKAKITLYYIVCIYNAGELFAMEQLLVSLGKTMHNSYLEDNVEERGIRIDSNLNMEGSKSIDWYKSKDSWKNCPFIGINDFKQMVIRYKNDTINKKTNT